jgi:hypothetical protein
MERGIHMTGFDLKVLTEFIGVGITFKNGDSGTPETWRRN